MAFNKRDKKRAERRTLRVRAKLKNGTQTQPRLSVFRSLNHIYAQMIDDIAGVTLVSSSSVVLKNVNGDKKAVAHAVGLDLAKRAKEKGISNALFDRGSNHYIGRVKALAEGVRAGGVQV